VLEVWDLIPVMSFVLLWGRCRYCKKKISPRNLYVELVMGFVFGLLGYKLGLNFDLSAITRSILIGIMFWTTLVIGVIDWERKLVSEVFVGIWLGLNVAYLLLAGQYSLSSVVVGVVVSLSVIGGIWAVTKEKAMGFGDVEIAFAMGLLLGWPAIIIGLWVAFISGAVVGVIKILTKKAKLKSQIAFGPFLLLGSWVGLIWGDKILAWLFPF
jgi:leader peptidase (prepilin peptidase)/N-methyltransferase